MIKRMTTILAAMTLAHLASAATRCADATGGDGEKALAADGTVRQVFLELVCGADAPQAAVLAVGARDRKRERIR